jgi:RNA polymerase sigma-70 factor, ECF subfamily
MKALDSDDPVDTTVPVPAEPRAEVWRLFSDHGQALYRFSRSLVGNAADAEDVVQETFLKLLEHLQSGGDRSNLRAWLFAVAANASRDRGRWRMRLLPWKPALDRRTVEPSDSDDQSDRRRAQRALKMLGHRDRLLLALRAHGLSYREIATAARIAEPSVGRLLARAIERWKRHVEE